MPPSPLFGACVRDRKGAKEDTATKRMRGRGEKKKEIKAVGVCSVCFFCPDVHFVSPGRSKRRLRGI